MGRARRAQKIAAAAAYGGGLGAAGVATAWGVLVGEAKWARRIVGTPWGEGLEDSGRYGAGPGDPLQMVVLGDSSARGLGVDAPHETVGAIVATAVAAFAGRPVELHNFSVVGAVSADLAGQLELVREGPAPQLAVIMVGANDITKRTPRAAAVRSLIEAATNYARWGPRSSSAPARTWVSCDRSPNRYGSSRNGCRVISARPRPWPSSNTVDGLCLWVTCWARSSKRRRR